MSRAEETEEREPRGREAKLNEKIYKRLEKFTGGELAWQEWRYDSVVIARAVNPEVSLALKDCLTMKTPKTGRELGEDLCNQPWQPTLRSG